MLKITLYKYTRKDGGITVSPELPPDIVDYTTLWRLIADDGYVLVKGETVTVCTDTEDDSGWEEEPIVFSANS